MRRRFAAALAEQEPTAIARLEAARRLAHRLEPHLAAFVELEAPPIGRREGPLAHVPYVVQDIFAAPHRVPTCGLSAPRKGLVTGESRPLRQLDEAGAVRIGLTETTALGLDPAGYNGRRAIPRNPWHQEFITGGAASGAGVAVASGAAAFALVRDTHGDARLPAAALGLTGWLPTEALLGSKGALVLAPSLDRTGMLARSARDLLPVKDVLLARDPGHEPVADAPIGRIAVVADLRETCAPSVRRAMSDGLDALETSGSRLELQTAQKALATVDTLARRLLIAESARMHDTLLSGDALDPATRRRLIVGHDVSEQVLVELRRRRGKLARDFTETFLAQADALATPVFPDRVPPVATAHFGAASFDAAATDRITGLTLPANHLGLPAVVVPVGRDDRGLPVGLQLIGRVGSDDVLLRAAARLQQRTDWHGALPDAISDMVADAEDLLA
jgi:aspartyl-tRNA(Asn)/glutamyl-tRNA(Gln) amidotransferase subunit A